MHDPPSFEVRNDLLYDVADLIDLLIELLLPTQEFAAFGLLEGCDHVVANVSLIAEPVARVDRKEHSGFGKAMIVMAASGDRIGDPCQASGNGAGDLHVHSSDLMLPGIQFRVRPPRPAREQRTVHDVARSGIEFIEPPDHVAAVVGHFIDAITNGRRAL